MNVQHCNVYRVLEQLMSVATSDLDIGLSNPPLVHNIVTAISSSSTWHCQHWTSFTSQQNCFFKHESFAPFLNRDQTRDDLFHTALLLSQPQRHVGCNFENVRLIMQRAILRFYRRKQNKEEGRGLSERREGGTRRANSFAPPLQLLVQSRDNTFYACTSHITRHVSLVDFSEELKYCWFVGWRVYSS
jgi:hypothetical protein